MFFDKTMLYEKKIRVLHLGQGQSTLIFFFKVRSECFKSQHSSRYLTDFEKKLCINYKI